MLAVPLSRGMLITRLRGEVNRHFTLTLDYSNQHNLCLRPSTAFRYTMLRIAWRANHVKSDC